MQEAEIPLYPEHAVESLLARAQAVAAGGKVLIPAFALGRAQEVLLILMAEQTSPRPN